MKIYLTKLSHILYDVCTALYHVGLKNVTNARFHALNTGVLNYDTPLML